MSSINRLTVALVLLAGCIPDPGFAEEEYIRSPRVLAIVADPPAVRPGQDARLRALVVDPAGRPISYRWSVCAQPELLGGGPFSGVQFEGAGNQPGCGDDALGLELGTSDTATFPGAISTALVERLDDSTALFDGLVSPELIRRVAEEVGVAVTVQLEVRIAGDLEVIATKRVLVRSGELPSTNPFPPRVTVGPSPEIVVDAREERVNDDFRCEPALGVAPKVAPRGRLLLRPSFDEGAWLERYRVLEPTGAIRELEERAFFSWFAAAGTLRDNVTQVPVEGNAWTAPANVGTYPIWVVVRDGHGGTSACRFDVVVE